ncbi:type II secretion system protein [Alkalimonas amylolytica]|uniref:MSHA pilin protein MshC n=1 Tax=Alkalimonas amylolytica TaxID=152573 RepID=A0A1H4FT03_ALKAM|nr:type II secretion system protein [Alkalimonas amylolytica]SEB00493.1 MSHA pilin protein MshC [Alkalimonas amylolytica]
MIRQYVSLKGFTLVELIVVMVLLGILSVTLLPRFLSGAGTSEYHYRDQALALLRRVQIQAMQCTDATFCPGSVLQLSSSAIGTSADCRNDATHLCIASRDVVTLSANFSQLSFDALGRPQGCAAATPACTLTITGSNSLQICLESEGYIRPC